MKLSEIASAVQARLEGTNVEITGVAGIEQAGAGQLTFVANPRYAGAARTTKAAALIVAEDFPALAAPTLRSANPYLAFARALELFYHPPRYAPGIHSTAVVHDTARIGPRAHLGAYVVVDEDVESGEGFGFAKDNQGVWHKIVQSGPAVLEDGVELQANACVDRASVGETRVKRGAKIDNLVQVGHGSTVGENSLLCAQVGLAGSTEVGKNVILAGQVGIAGHCRIGDGVVATAQSGIPNDVEDGKMVSGYPAMDNRQWLRCVAAFQRLPEILKAVRSRVK